MPDIDLDFAPEGRAQIIRHLEDTYGSDSVRPIVAFSELKAKAAIKDVARALEIPPSRADAVCKFIPSVPAMTLEEALGNIPEVRDAYEKDAEMREVIDRAKGLEGVVRQCTVHASGVVIGDKALENYTPLYYNPSTETVTTQYEMKVIDKVGLLKVDILGLATLSLVRKTLEIIEQTGKEVPDLEKLATDDKETFRLLGKGRSKGIFQFESEGMRRLLQQARPSNIEDLIALNALFRPGPLKNGFTDMWVKRKHGREKTTTLHPLMDEVLRPTYGVIVYQEQVMRLASELAGFTLSEADSLRRAMGKKDEETMERFRAIFVAGAKTRGIEERTAGAVYDSMSRFAEYGFNKSHAAAYALVAYRTAYLKAHYPSEFMAALLSIESDPKKVVQYIDEARGMGINVLPPDVNESRKDFTVVENGVRFGLATVKGVGEKATDSIIGAREAGGAFGDIFDFVERVDTRLVNKQVLVTLAKAGALDSLDIRRKQALMVIEDVLAYASGRQTAANRGQVSLFAGGVEEEALRPQVPDVVEMPDQEMRKNEKEVLGFYVSSHPMNEYAAAVKEFVERGLGQTEELSDGEEVTVAGIVSGLVVKRSRRSGEQWAAVTLEDLEGQVEGIVYPSVYAEARDKLENDRLVFVRGRAKVEEGGAKIMADEVFTLAEAPAMLYSRVVVRVDDSGGDRLDRIRKAVRAHPGPVDFCIELCEDGQKVLIQAGEEHRVNPVEEFVEKLEEITGAGSVRKVGQARYRNGNGGRRGSSRRYGRGRR
ncbi:MAG: DNA polymerase III subunit alpha, partial [Planctomycetes bacterium]|nr:DNA polymerase III subunit alpha [Planctomycetota bacterium]